MLYQRWITESRQQEVIGFWNQASKRRSDEPRKYLVGPNAITAALFDDPIIDNGKLILSYDRPFRDEDSLTDKLAACAGIVMNRMRPRLTVDELSVLSSGPPWPDLAFAHNYVLESLCQIQWAFLDPQDFIDKNEIEESSVRQLVESLEALCRPALIVDGQHRLFGAANADAEILLPVVAIPSSPWMEQIYQFVVINEKAKKVDSSLLTDIFGSSLTPSEQTLIRRQLVAAGASVDPRIAAVVASRDVGSPFYGMVKINLDGDPPGIAKGFIPDATIRQLIDGGSGSKGWRSDDSFYEKFVSPTFPDRQEWDSYSDGLWRPYWFAFWSAVKEWYNAEASLDLWSEKQSNLTKAVTLKLFQKLFMAQAATRVEGVLVSRATLVDVLGEEVADEKLLESIEKVAIPRTPEEFAEMVRSWFLQDGVPVRVFEYPWVSSLDDSSGQQALYEELEEAFKHSKDPLKKYRAQNNKIFTTPDK
ncbi:hypothetical protein ASD37_08390 [Mycobacterium sp. Root135]|nr:hypothetical protein ASD37_08390 [Mycobacterium sp. Root135]